MSLAPASSLGAFLKARLAVNGIQCAARSFGTLTAVGRGLLSSMRASCGLGIGESGARDQLRCETGTPTDRISVHSDSLRTACSQIGGAGPEHPTLRNLRVEAHPPRIRE